MTTYIVLPEGWAGGWQYRQVASCLEGEGCTVFAPSFSEFERPGGTASRDNVLETRVQDAVGLIRREDLRGVILVGFASTGEVASGVAKLLPERIGHLVYVDAPVSTNGSNGAGHSLPVAAITFIRCTARSFFSAATAPSAYQARASGWAYFELPAEDVSRVATPEELAAKLLQIA